MYLKSLGLISLTNGKVKDTDTGINLKIHIKNVIRFVVI